MEGLGVDAIGVNCSLGPKELEPVVAEFLRASLKRFFPVGLIRSPIILGWSITTVFAGLHTAAPMAGC